jgi:murein tripeptide amidase MpaA
MRRTLLAAAIAVAGLNTAAAREWVVEAHYPDSAALARAAAQFQHVIVDAKRNVLRVNTDEGGMRTLEDAGLDIGIDEAASAKLDSFYAKFEQAKSAGLSPDSIPGFQCFRTVEETYSTMDTLVANHPGIVAIDEIGPTWKKSQNAAQGYTMRALRITNLATAASDPDRPKMVVFTSIHAREYSPAELDTRFAEWLINNYGTDPEATWLVDHNDFRLVLQANPDARKTAEQQIYQRKNLDTTNAPCSSQTASSQPGVDLNRNFPFHWNITNGGGSSGTKCNETYRGPLKSSEPETQNLVQYVAGTCTAAGVCSGGVFVDRRTGSMNPASVDDGGAAPDDTTGFFIDIHSNASLVLWPWGDTSSAAPNQAAMRTLGRRLAYFNGYAPEQSDSLYPTDGTTDDTMYGLLGVPGFTIETNGSDFFEDCATFEGNTAPTNIAALRYVARALHAPYKLPSGPDTISVAGASDLIASGDPIAINAQIDDTRFNQSTAADSVPGTIRNIASANAYVDTLPWDPAAQPIALGASDGAFNGPTERVNGTLPGNGLAIGKHLVYVQGVDVTGNAGPPNAALINIVDAAAVGTLGGKVSDYATTAPLAATVALSKTGEAHQAISDGATGNYVAHGYPGTFDVHVSAPHHLAEDLHGVDLAAGATVTHDFALYPNCSIISDDVEGGIQGWTAQSPWVIVNNVSGNTTHVWNTPNYGDNLDTSLTSAAHDLTGYSDVTLDFDDRCSTESGYDFGYVEYSANNGTSWNALYSCNGQSSWQSHHFDLPAGANGAAAFKLRFRLTSDVNTNASGWAIDNIKLEAGGAACRAQQPNDVIFANGFEG